MSPTPLIQALPPRRRGVGMLLLLIIGFLVVMTLIGLSQKHFTSQVATQTSRSAWGEIALSFAESAIEEAMNQVKTGVNDRDNPLFTALRKPCFIQDLGYVPLSDHVSLPQLNRILEDPQFSKFSVKELEVQVKYQRQFQSLGYEKFGLITYRAKVGFNINLTESINREVEVGQGFKVTLQTAPRPYDQTIFISYLDNPQQDLRLTDVDVLYRKYLAKVRDVIDLAEVQHRAELTPSSMRPRYEEIARNTKPVSYWQAVAHEFPTEPCVIYAVKPDGESVDLKTLDLIRTIEDKDKKVMDPLRKRLDDAMGYVSGNPEDPVQHEKLVGALTDLSNGLAEVMTDIKSFYQDWLFATGDMKNDLARFRYKLTYEHWKRKAYYHLRETDPLPIEKQFERLLTSITPISGILLCDNTKKPLVIDGAKPEVAGLKGKLIVVCGKKGPDGPGGMIVRNVGRDETPADLLTLICLEGDMVLEGEVHAAVICGGGGRLVIKPGTKIHGLVVTERMPSPDEREGTIIRLDKYYSGRTLEKDGDQPEEFHDYYFVGVNPQIVYKKVAR